MSTTARRIPVTQPSRERTVRAERAAAAVASGGLAALYAVLTYVVREAEIEPGATDSTTWGGYLFLMVAYAVGTGLVVTVRRSWVYAGGAVAQVLVLGLFVVFGIGLLGPGLFEYAALADLPMGAAALVACAVEVALLAVLVDLWRRTRRRRA